MEDLVLIISAYGRGHGLAVQLQQAGVPVKLMEISDSLGTWIPEEIEGPFGFFQSERIAGLQHERLVEDDPLIALPQGFCVWLKSGPFELQGPNAAHLLQKLKLDNDLRKDSKKKTWLTELAAFFGANSDSQNRLSFLPLFSKFSVRLPTRQGFNKSLEWCRRNGVNIVEKAHVVDLTLADRRNLKAIEYSIDRSEKTLLQEFSNIVWCLSSEETSLLSPKVFKTLFTNGALEPDWVWTRFRIRVSEGMVRNQIPNHSILIRDLEQPWTHENFMILLRTASADQFDLWIKMPGHQRFNKNYLDLRGQYIIEELTKKFINLNVEIVNYPVGYEKTFKDVGPARQPVYKSAQLNKFKKSQFSNVIFNSSEQADGLGLNYFFNLQTDIFNQLEVWWKKHLLKKQKNRPEATP